MQMWCLAVSMLWCSLVGADLIVGIQKLKVHYRCRGRSNFPKIRIATIWRMLDVSGAIFCTGDFAPLTPEFGPEFWETNFGRPNFGPKFLGRILWSYFFQGKEAPSKIHCREIHLPKFNPEIGQKNSHCTSAGPFGWSDVWDFLPYIYMGFSFLNDG